VAKAKEKELDVLAVFKKKAELREARLALEAEVKALSTEEKLLESLLIANIPEGATKHGVYHSVSSKKTPKWSEILPILKDKYIPKAKLAEAEAVIDDHSTLSFTHSFKEAT
jgi:hypothetical protein